jgi:hypothetical protein
MFDSMNKVKNSRSRISKVAHQLNIQQFYVLPTQLIYAFFYGSENKQRLFPYTTLTDWFL